jgi:hypothetical protein
MSTFKHSSPATEPARYQRAKELAGAAGMSTGFAAESYAASWIDGLADDAAEAVGDAAERDNLHDPAEACNNPHELVPQAVTATRSDAWKLVYQLGAWRATDWDTVLDHGWTPDDTQRDHPSYGSVHGPVTYCLTMPADPGELADMMLRQLAERVLRLAVERRKAELEDE